MNINTKIIIQTLCESISDIIAIYAFGSHIQGVADESSDLDLAVLVPGYVEPMILWSLTSNLEDLIHCSVDLLDLRAASTVMQYQVIMTGERWWAKDSQASIYEAFILSEKTALDEARAGVIADIQKEGKVYGR